MQGLSRSPRGRSSLTPIALSPALVVHLGQRADRSAIGILPDRHGGLGLWPFTDPLRSVPSRRGPSEQASEPAREVNFASPLLGFARHAVLLSVNPTLRPRRPARAR